MESFETLETCRKIEEKCAVIYWECSRLFPEATDLFRDLAIEEENHAVILKLARTYVKYEKLHVSPIALEHIREAEQAVEAMLEALKSGVLALKQALEMSLALEQSTGESYLRDMMTGNPGSEIIAKLQEMLADEGSHIERIQAFIEKQGVR